MTEREYAPLAPYTSLGVGGPARLLIEAEEDTDVRAALLRARKLGWPLKPLGAGTNILVPDAGVDAIVLRLCGTSIVFTQDDTRVILVADAGTLWDDVVDAASTRGLWGIENLAGIPGNVGGALVQNIGAYGVEFADTFLYADTIDGISGDVVRIGRMEARFGYRRSVCKFRKEFIILRVALALSRTGSPNLLYADLASAEAAGITLATPAAVASAIRAIRASKFPGPGEGSAGSFFKNPVLSAAEAATLSERYPGVPCFPQKDSQVKVSLAWLLDHALGLKGFRQGPVRLYEKQPLILVASYGATARDIDMFANDVARRVHDATGIVVEREVETFDAMRAS